MHIFSQNLVDEKDLIDGYYSNTLHEDELANGLRQRLRVSGAISDRSVGIETIASQQNKRRKNNPKPENAKTQQNRKPVQFGPVPRSKPRKRYMTEDFSKPMSSKAELPVQIVVDRRGEASLKWQLPDGRIYYDTDLPKLPGEVIQQACGETTVFRMRDGNEAMGLDAYIPVVSCIFSKKRPKIHLPFLTIIKRGKCSTRPARISKAP